MALDTTQSDQLFADARSAQQNVIDITEQGGKLPSMLRDAVSERFSQSPLWGQREKAAEQYITSVPRARENIGEMIRSGTILSPTQQQSIISGQRAADVVPLLSLNDLLQAQTGGMETAIAGGLGQFNAMLNALTQSAGLQQQSAESAFQRAVTEEQLRQKDVELAKSGSGGGGGLLEQLLAASMMGGMGGGIGSDIDEILSEIGGGTTPTYGTHPYVTVSSAPQTQPTGGGSNILSNILGSIPLGPVGSTLRTVAKPAFNFYSRLFNRGEQ